MAKSPVQLEMKLEQHDKDIGDIHNTLKEMVLSINGLRTDMAERGMQMITMLNTQNTMLIKNQTDHEANDITRFSEIKTQMAYYLGYAVGGGAVIAALVSIAGVYFGRH